MKKFSHFAVAAVVMFAMAACGNANTNQQEVNNGEEPVVENPEPVAQEPTTYEHYEWQMTLPAEGWEVSNAYSDMGIDKDNLHFNVKDWKDTTIERCAPNGGCLEENRQEDIVTGDYTWVVYTKTNSYDVACYTFDPIHNMVVRVGVETLEDPKDPRLMTVLEGFAVIPAE